MPDANKYVEECIPSLSMLFYVCFSQPWLHLRHNVVFLCSFVCNLTVVIHAIIV